MPPSDSMLGGFHILIRRILAMKTNNFEYLLSRHYLKKLVAEKAITYEEFDKIDKLNKQKFKYKEMSPNIMKSAN
jgi:hypothetical protein